MQLIVRLAFALLLLGPAPALARSGGAALPDPDEEAPAPKKAKKKATLPEPEEEAPAPRRRTNVPAPDEEEEQQAPAPRYRRPPAEEEPPPRKPPPPPPRRRSLEDLDDEDEGKKKKYDEEEEGGRRGQLHSGRPYQAEDDTEESYGRRERLRNLGIGGELTFGAMLVQSSAGAGPDGRLGVGLRVAWEFAKLLSKSEDDWWRDALAIELAWMFTSVTGVGTTQVQVDAYYHYFSLAWIAGWPIGSFLLYGELGPSLSFQPVSYLVDGARTSFGAGRLGLLYGIGGRAKFLFNDDKYAVLLRFEIIRYRRGYMNDTFLGVSVGFGF